MTTRRKPIMKNWSRRLFGCRPRIKRSEYKYEKRVWGRGREVSRARARARVNGKRGQRGSRGKSPNWQVWLLIYRWISPRGPSHK